MKRLEEQLVSHRVAVRELAARTIQGAWRRLRGARSEQARRNQMQKLEDLEVSHACLCLVWRLTGGKVGRRTHVVSKLVRQVGGWLTHVVSKLMREA
eukprot:254388-Chlamydomonas_euryale.AAC.4